MATELMLTKTIGGQLRPADALAEEALKGLSQGEVYKVKLSKPRNGKHHRKFMALCKIILDNTERYDAMEDVITMFKIATGHFKEHTGKHGEVIYIPKSISFAKMDQLEFNAFYDRCINKTVRHILVGLPESDLRNEIEDICLGY